MARPMSVRLPTTAAAVAMPLLVPRSVMADLPIIPPYIEKMAKKPETPHSTYGTTVVGHQKWSMKAMTATALAPYTAMSHSVYVLACFSSKVTSYWQTTSLTANLVWSWR